MADTNFAKPQGVQGIFSAFDLAEAFSGDGTAVLDPRGETCARGFVGEGETGFAGERANLLLGEARGDQRGERVVQNGGLLARAEFNAVIKIHPVG